MPQTAPTMVQPAVRRGRGLLSFFDPDPPAPITLPDGETVQTSFKRWQSSVLLWSIVGYATFYFVRKNLSIAMPVMGEQLGIGKPQLGMFLTLHGVLYGISKFANGFWGDRANARRFMVTGLFLSALTNIVFGFSSAVVVLGLVWMLNGWFQGMGFPPCARLMTHWFPPRELATKMSLWNTSHSIGAGLILILCGYLATVSWRLCFLVPAAIAISCSILLLWKLPDTPRSVGLPEIEGTETASGDHSPTDEITDETQSAAEFRAFVRRHVFGNKYIWLIAIANFFVYTIRYAVLDWGPTLLKESKGIEIYKAGWIVMAFEFSGVVGMIFSGWLTDRLFKGRGARTCVFSMLGCIAAVAALWRYGNSAASCTVILCAAGFFIYGPQALVGSAVANLATKRAAATAVGLTGAFGYASTTLSGVGMGMLVKYYGWNAAFAAMIVLAGCGVLSFILAWPSKAHGYAE